MIAQDYILALDQGTTSSRAMLFDMKGMVQSKAQKNIKQIYPHSGWVEHDPEEIWRKQMSVAEDCMDNVAGRVRGIGITNQRETIVVWNKETGVPIYNAIVWQDKRTADYCASIDRTFSEIVQEKTGLVIDPYFSASKIKWILDNVEGARKDAGDGKLLCGTIDSWLVWKMTNGALHLTDPSNASRTMLYNIHTLHWDDELLAYFDIPRNMLPEVRSSSELYGKVTFPKFLEGTPIAGIAGDQQAAMFGQRCFKKGSVKSTYGTGCFLLMNTSDQPIKSHHKLLTTIAWQLNGVTTYALEGSVFIGGAIIQWLREGLELAASSEGIAKLAENVTDNDGVVFVPSLAGLGAPYWEAYARGTILGITRKTKAGHIARAGLEAIAFQSRDLLIAMGKDADVKIEMLKADGGASKNNSLMQFQSNISEVEVRRPGDVEATALGAAFLAGLGVGFWKHVSNIEDLSFQQEIFSPINDKDKNNAYVREWERAVSTVQFWAQQRDDK